MQILTTFEKDDFIALVSFKNPDAVPDLSSATIEAYMKSQSGGAAISGSTSVVDGKSIRVAFNDGDFAEGRYYFQVRVILDGVTRTVASAKVVVEKSI